MPGNWKEQIQASGLGQTKKCPWWNALQESHLSPGRPQPGLIKLPLLPQEGSQVVHGLKRLWVIRAELCFPPCKSSAVQGIHLASRDGTGGVGPQARIRLRVPCGKGRKVSNGLEFGLMKKMSSTIIPCKCTHNSKLEESNAKFDELTFQHNLDVRHRRSNLPFANKLQPQGASVLWFFAETLWQPQTSQTSQYLSLATDSHSDSQNSSSLGNKKIHQFLVPATCLPPKDSIPASSNLPCFSKTTAKLLADLSVSGCWAPSWDSKPSKARRQRPSAWRLEMEH